MRATPYGGWIEFDAPLDVLPWGRNTYTVLYVDDRLHQAAAEAATRRVEGRLDGIEVNLGINRADVAVWAFLYIGAPLQRKLGVRAGDLVTCRLRPADPDDVPVPADVHAALQAAGRADTFSRRRPADRRRLLQPIEGAVRQETRQRRIEDLLRSLSPD